MIKGLTITPPILGRISIGHIVEKNGKFLPQKDDQFTITSQIQNKDGWVRHPIDEKLRSNSDNGKLRKIPVRMIFNDPELNFRAEYTMFDRQTGRPICVGNGETCQRRTQSGLEQLPCPSPNACQFGTNGNCKPFGRLYVNLSEDDELGAFVFRTTGFNSIRTLMARLSYFSAISDNRLSYLPLQLVIRGKSTTQSYRTPIYYVDLTLQDNINLQEAIHQAKNIDDELKSCGFNQNALEYNARLGYANSDFGIDDETSEVLDEFYPAEMQDLTNQEQFCYHSHPQSKSNNLDPAYVNEWKGMEIGLKQSVSKMT